MKREAWNAVDWIVVVALFFTVIGTPVALAALGRKLFGQSVFHPEQFTED